MSRNEELKILRAQYSKMNKENRCLNFSKSKNIQNSYKDNTLKEELVLEHLIQFKKEFAAAIDPKRDLFLYPMNETKKYKFICTTIRPTKVPYPELYDFQKCANFIADFIEYEELIPPNQFPKYIPAPDNVLLWQIGDCFDISIVLCSLLIGVGYNAFVVYGKAPREITTKDQTDLEIPEYPDDIRIPPDNDLEDDEEEKKNMIKPMDYKKKLESTYENDLLAEQANNEKLKWKQENEIDDDEGEYKRYDPWDRKRLHCWILIKKNKRMDEDACFIEPATGRKYPIDNIPFYSIDAVFNNNNFWINLSPDKPINEIDFTFTNKNAWENVMLGNKETEEIDETELDQERTVDTTEQNIIDMPPAWPNKLFISQYAYNNRIPVPTQTFYFRKSKVDKYSTYSQVDGKILAIFRYKDFARVRLDEVEIRYRNRCDKLYKRIKKPYEHKIVDFYLPGQEYGWKKIEEVEAEYRTILYYETNYDTGLIYRHEQFGKKIIHKYKSRDDKVYERKVELGIGREEILSKEVYLESALFKEKFLISKFTQKYNINPLILPQLQIQRLVCQLKDNFEIGITYHFAKGKIKAETDKFYDKENESSMGTDDREENLLKSGDDKEKLRKRLITVKKDSITNFLKIEEKYNEHACSHSNYIKKIYEYKNRLIQFKGDIFDNGILEKHLFDKELDGNEKTSVNNQDYTGAGHRFDRIEFFVKLEKEKREKEGNKIDPKEIKNAIINIFKEEKMHVTNILQAELKEQMNSLNKEIEEFKNKDKEVNVKDIDDHNDRINDIQRKINIIYQRSHRHIVKIMEELNVLMTSLEDKEIC